MDWHHHRCGVHHELNYLISEDTARQVRNLASLHLVLDEAAVGCPNHAYPVRTIYLDSDKLTFYRQAINDPEHRCLLRMRSYDANPNSAIRVEIKRRLADIVMRESCAVRRGAIAFLLAGQMPPWELVVSRDEKARVALEEFLVLVTVHRAKPVLHVSYLREAYVTVGENNDARITLDRQIACERSSANLVSERLDHPTPLFRHSVLLELNCAARYPDWFQDLVETCNLTACEADKFLEGMFHTSGKHATVLRQ